MKHSIVAFVGIHAVFAVKQRLRRPPTSLLALHATDITAPLVTGPYCSLYKPVSLLALSRSSTTDEMTTVRIIQWPIILILNVVGIAGSKGRDSKY